MSPGERRLYMPLVGQLSSLLAAVGDLAGGDKDSGRVSTCPMGNLRVKGMGLLLAKSNSPLASKDTIRRHMTGRRSMRSQGQAEVDRVS